MNLRGIAAMNTVLSFLVFVIGFYIFREFRDTLAWYRGMIVAHPEYVAAAANLHRLEGWLWPVGLGFTLLAGATVIGSLVIVGIAWKGPRREVKRT